MASLALVGGLVGKALRYTLNVVIANGLGAAALGVFALGMVLLRAGSVLARLGLDNAAQKYIPVYTAQDDDRALNGTALLCLSAPFFMGITIAGGVFVFDDTIRELAGVTLQPVTKQFALGIPFFATMMVGIGNVYVSDSANLGNGEALLVDSQMYGFEGNWQSPDSRQYTEEKTQTEVVMQMDAFMGWCAVRPEAAIKVEG